MNRVVAALVFTAFVMVPAGAARAQGSNDCASATPISGLGTFAVTTVGSTDSVQQTGVCPTAHHDVWFAWTATATESINFTTCGGTTADTVIAVYPGTGCPIPLSQLACNDDVCGQQSSLYFDAIAGQSYLLQIGAWNGTTTFSGSFFLSAFVNPCASHTGPDVITGDITDVVNANASGGLDAFTLGTTSCNIGTSVVSWQGGNPLHPVIAETFYKYKVVNGAGRFEEIGIGWLKHGFAADTGSLCCTCQNPGNNQFLGVGCSDAYIASQSATQSSLAPRWQVNAHTGVFPYPGANPIWSGSTARRTEVALAELEPTAGTTRYYAECTYITQDDALAGNNNNNASYKEITVTGGPSNYTFNPTGQVHRMMPAIEGWQVLEPGVTITDVQVPGDGLIVVGSHATSLGGGVYHYEFAVHNMNADRAVGSFSVPIPAGANVTNAGFHDITYRNGDGQLGINQTSTDWPPIVAAGSITWACETNVQNANANAIRWQGTYNFRFDADVAPASGNMTVGLWRPGSPPTVTAAGDVPGGGPTTFAYCFGDGSGSACPCSNESMPGSGSGCLNSLGTGAALTWSGNASVTADTFVLHGAGMPDSSALYFQGTVQASSGAGAAFGDGLRCASGSLVRLPAKTNSGGASLYPDTGDSALSVIGMNVAGNVRMYQCWYRNAAAFCQPETFNLTNGVQTTWQP